VRRWAALASVAALSACTNEVISGGPGGCFTGEGGPSPRFDAGAGAERVLLQGHEELVDLVLSVTGCGDALRSATSVETTVLGPDNLPVAHQHSTPSSESFEHRVTVTFTPAAAGPYHFVAVFQPNLGIAQLDLRAARDFTQVPTELTLPATCEQLAVTSSSAVLCLQTPNVLVFRAGAQVQSLNGSRLSVSDNTVWITDDFTAVRYLDTGNGPLQQSSPSVTLLTTSPLTIVGGALDLWVAAGYELRHYREESGAFVSHERWSVPSTGSDVVLGHDDGGMLLASTGWFCSTQDADAGQLACSMTPFFVLGTYGAAAGIWGGPEPTEAELHVTGRTSARVTVPAVGDSAWDTQPLQGDAPKSSQYTIVVQDGVATLAKWSEAPFEVLDGWAAFRNGTATELKRIP
jgi:hypothetical protein